VNHPHRLYLPDTRHEIPSSPTWRHIRPGGLEKPRYGSMSGRCRGDCGGGLRRGRRGWDVYRRGSARRGAATASGEGADHPGQPGCRRRAWGCAGVAGCRSAVAAPWHDDGHQRGAGAQDRPDGLGDHGGLRRCVADCPAEPASTVRPDSHPSRAAGAARPGGHRRRADGSRRRGCDRADRRGDRAGGAPGRAPGARVGGGEFAVQLRRRRPRAAAVRRLDLSGCADHPVQCAAAGVPRVRASLDVRAQRRRRTRDAPLPVEPEHPVTRSDDHRDDLRRWYRGHRVRGGRPGAHVAVRASCGCGRGRCGGAVCGLCGCDRLRHGWHLH
jgi:hypothetical protein